MRLAGLRGRNLELAEYRVLKRLEQAGIPCDPQRRVIRSDAIFHEKTGIIEDKTGDRVAFSGSINETVSGWTTNWESFNCFTSWNDADRVDAEEASFSRLCRSTPRRRPLSRF